MDIYGEPVIYKRHRYEVNNLLPSWRTKARCSGTAGRVLEIVERLTTYAARVSTPSSTAGRIVPSRCSVNS
jgi:hypothetical protein